MAVPDFNTYIDDLINKNAKFSAEDFNTATLFQKYILWLVNEQNTTTASVAELLFQLQVVSAYCINQITGPHSSLDEATINKVPEDLKTPIDYKDTIDEYFSQKDSAVNEAKDHASVKFVNSFSNTILIACIITATVLLGLSVGLGGSSLQFHILLLSSLVTFLAAGYTMYKAPAANRKYETTEDFVSLYTEPAIHLFPVAFKRSLDQAVACAVLPTSNTLSKQMSKIAPIQSILQTTLYHATKSRYGLYKNFSYYSKTNGYQQPVNLTELNNDLIGKPASQLKI